MKIFAKIQAGSLQFVVFIGVVVALLLGSFLTLVHIHNLFGKQTDVTIQTVKHADIGIAYALQNTIRENDSVTIPFLSEGDKSIKVSKSEWGVFEKVSVVSKNKNKSFIKTALAGGQYPAKERPALYLVDDNRPLVVVGNTKIEGLAYVPKQGVRSGNISGTSYFSKTFIYGESRVSKNILPELSPEVKKSIEILSQPNFKPGNNELLKYKPKSVFKNSFQNPVQYVFHAGTLDLSASTLIGNIIVQSTEKIIVDPSSILKDVILSAPEIEIRSGSTGNFQAIASKKIEVGSNCNIQYPSALILNDQSAPNIETNFQQQNVNQVQIGKGTIFKGIVISLGKDNTMNFNPQIVIEENAQVFGEVYCDQSLELKGTVNGSVFTSKFIAKQFGSVYQNHIYHGKILNSELPVEYVGLNMETRVKKVVKWVY